MSEKDIDDVNEGLNESDDNLYGPCFTVNFGLYDIPITTQNDVNFSDVELFTSF